ncbi:MAG TPA: PAS domain-containing sensor histidine kinase, partial [Methanoregula sp.]|nr:PAS domain-containing sensor histidine kinase [Methanoregula sp.]
YMNEFLVRAMGYTRAEMASMDYWVHVKKDQQEKIIEDGRAWARGEPGPWINEIEYYTRSGERRWAVSSSAHIMYGGRHAGIVTLIGITDRKKAENELRAAYDQLAAVNCELKEQYARAEEGRKRLQQSERDYRSIIDNIQDAFYRTDPAGTLTMISPSFVRLMGYEDEQEILGKNVRNQFYADPRDRDRFLQELERTGTVQEHRVTLRRRDGSTVVFMASSHLIRDDAGKPAGVEGILHDMTRIDKAEEALRESEAKYRLLADHVHDVIWTAGMDMRLTYISPSITALRGLTPEEALAEDVRTALTPASYATIMQQREKALPGLLNGGPVQEFQSMDLEFYKKDGSTVWTETVLSPAFDRDGTPCGVVGVMRDITKRKRAEDALRQANRKLNLLTGITRHDIRNQLLVLKGYMRLIEKDIGDPLLLAFCRKATESAERISSMIQFTKEYEELGSAAPAWQAVRPLLDTALQQAAAGTVVAIENTIPESLEVLADPLIIKVFYNLTDNALQHGETITTIRFSSEEQPGGLVIVCEDNGTGVPAGEKDLIFERGFGKNSGLGLSLSQEILSITGMTIRETGVPGRGARFEITVPSGTYRCRGP